MKADRLAMSEVVLLEPKMFTDERGVFFEIVNRRQHDEAVGRTPINVEVCFTL